MKTAMTEFIEYAKKVWGWDEEFELKSKELLEKEKWQIVSAINETKINIRHSSNYSGEEYYNQFYNQNK